MIAPQLAPPEVNVLSVTVRAAVSAESLTLIVVEAGRVLDDQRAEDALDAAGVAHVDRVVTAAGAQGGQRRRWRGR